MKKLLIIALLSVASPAFAQTAATPVVKDPQVKEQKFEARKAEVLKRVNDKITELQQRQQCVQAATTADALKACKPVKSEGHKGCLEK